jgi:hypothetical protein
MFGALLFATVVDIVVAMGTILSLSIFADCTLFTFCGHDNIITTPVTAPAITA